MPPTQQALVESGAGRASQGAASPLVVILARADLSRAILDGLTSARCVQAPPDRETGLRTAERLRPELILVDASSVSPAVEPLIRAARESPALANTPLIVLTGRAEDELRARLLRAGANDWLAVPFSPEELRTRVSNVLAARQARDAQARIASLVEQAPDGIFVADLDARYTDVNEAGCRMLGYAREELLGKTILDLIPPEEVSKLAESKAILLGGQVQVATWRLKKKDGTYLPVEVSAKILPDGRWQGFVRDISERVRAEGALRRAEALSSGILLTSAYAIVCIDAAQRMTMFNQGAERIFGYAASELLGEPLIRLIPERLRAVHQREVEAFLSGPERSRAMETRGKALFGLRKSGEEFPIEAVISKVSMGGEIVGTVALRDVSAERHAEAEQRTLADVGAALACLEPDQMLERLAAVLVHSLSDLASVFLVSEEPPKLRRAAMASRDPSLDRDIDALMTLPLGPRPENPVWRALQT